MGAHQRHSLVVDLCGNRAFRYPRGTNFELGQTFALTCAHPQKQQTQGGYRTSGFLASCCLPTGTEAVPRVISCPSRQLEAQRPTAQSVAPLSFKSGSSAGSPERIRIAVRYHSALLHPLLHPLVFLVGPPSTHDAVIIINKMTTSELTS